MRCIASGRARVAGTRCTPQVMEFRHQHGAVNVRDSWVPSRGNGQFVQLLRRSSAWRGLPVFSRAVPGGDLTLSSSYLRVMEPTTRPIAFPLDALKLHIINQCCSRELLASCGGYYRVPPTAGLDKIPDSAIFSTPGRVWEALGCAQTRRQA